MHVHPLPPCICMYTLHLWMCINVHKWSSTHIDIHLYVYLYTCTSVYLLPPALPWGLVASLPRSTQTLIKHFTVERKSLTILSTTMTGTCMWGRGRENRDMCLSVQACRLIHVHMWTCVVIHHVCPMSHTICWSCLGTGTVYTRQCVCGMSTHVHTLCTWSICTVCSMLQVWIQPEAAPLFLWKWRAVFRCSCFALPCLNLRLNSHIITLSMRSVLLVSRHIWCTCSCKYKLLATGEFGCVMNGQLNLVRTDVMSGSQSVSIKMLTGELMCPVRSYSRAIAPAA